MPLMMSYDNIICRIAALSTGLGVQCLKRTNNLPKLSRSLSMRW